LGYALKADLLNKTFWTMSAWDDQEALTAFVRSDVHRKAMTSLQSHMDDPRIKTYEASGSKVPPTWPDLARELA
jgi:heme-degrading monooxygenase HmoA